MKRILSFIIILIALLILIAVTGNIEQRKDTNSDTTQFESINPRVLNTNNLIPSIPTLSLPEPQLTLPSLKNTLVNRAWSVFQDYLENARDHNLSSLKLLSHQISSVCNDPTQEEDCFSRMDHVYALGSEFEKKDFVNVWSDEKQLILATDYKSINEPNFEARGLIRKIIFFTISDSGSLKILSFNDLDGGFVLKGDASNEEVDLTLLEIIRDSDEDGVSDQIETCDNLTSSMETCLKTDPKLRDTDKDGWWDGIERFFY